MTSALRIRSIDYTDIAFKSRWRTQRIKELLRGPHLIKVVGSDHQAPIGRVDGVTNAILFQEKNVVSMIWSVAHENNVHCMCVLCAVFVRVLCVC